MNAVNPIQSPTSPAAGGAEPSMEEILASIRRIIADDGVTPRLDGPRDHDAGGTDAEATEPGAIAGKHVPPHAPHHAPPEVERALEPLSHDAVAHDAAHEAMESQSEQDGIDPRIPPSEGPMTETAADQSKHPLAPAPEMLGLGPVLHDAPVLKPAARHNDASASEAPRAPERLFASAVDSSVTAAFNTLAASRFVDNAEQLSNLVSEMIRPLVKAWVDDNLPGMVERLVVAEIERMARGG